MLNSNPLIIFGAGGHSKVLCDILTLRNETISYFIDDRLAGTTRDGVLCISESDLAKTLGTRTPRGIVAIGDNAKRAQIAKRLKDAVPSFEFLTAIHPSAIISGSSTIGPGTVVMPGTVIGPGSIIGSHCIVNTHSSIDHDCVLEDFSSVAPGATLGGSCHIGKYSAVSLGAQIIHGIQIGEETVIGAGSCVTKNLPSHVVAYGTPAKVQRSRKSGDAYL